MKREPIERICTPHRGPSPMEKDEDLSADPTHAWYSQPRTTRSLYTHLPEFMLQDSAKHKDNNSH